MYITTLAEVEDSLEWESSSPTSFGTGSLCWSVAYWDSPVWLPSWSKNTGIIELLHPALHWFWEPEPRSSDLGTKHFACWVISPAHPDFYVNKLMYLSHCCVLNFGQSHFNPSSHSWEGFCCCLGWDLSSGTQPDSPSAGIACLWSYYFREGRTKCLRWPGDCQFPGLCLVPSPHLQSPSHPIVPLLGPGMLTVIVLQYRRLFT